ncbi:sarcosine oxidase subunit gamma [Oharaeibacter diazotrophicus]|uniref:Sarcosine oxidase subunit gamma n=2 Tax=Oharaeibacter diazotrophicus TaxID=1920512 RepID=A0A4R6RFU4_9HYPH|nr:sarcosine oxidase subunit gamma family protein [Oharaeibacter diazotrophicus]TDP85219.1 sarcosine oxidase subunit gamma [Oharaeibacter diazotrophicus]BBE74189.1 sarcosine oxidase, gamma subunit family [Pleomorphomonas sp. SM30]GLS76123.1 sarcosine oxidase subunit gamma [Oharaeibacter diazotrophicus]
MADLGSARRAVFDGRAFASPADHALAIAPVAPATRLVVRGRPAVAAAAAAAIGFPLPTDVCAVAEAGGIAALWLSPDEWLVIAPAGRDDLALALETALAGVPHAVVDVSHRNTGLALAGPRAAFVLNHGCPRDLSPAAFPVGTASRTLFGKAEIVLWRTGPDAFRIEVWRSYAPYVAGLLEEARREFEVAGRPA